MYLEPGSCLIWVFLVKNLTLEPKILTRFFKRLSIRLCIILRNKSGMILRSQNKNDAKFLTCSCMILKENGGVVHNFKNKESAVDCRVMNIITSAKSFKNHA